MDSDKRHQWGAARAPADRDEERVEVREGGQDSYGTLYGAGHGDAKSNGGSGTYYGSDEGERGRPDHVAVQVTRGVQGSGTVRQLFTRYNSDTYDPSKETHYVMVIHGTFDAPPSEMEPTPWYWLDRSNPRNFCGTLKTDLSTSALSAASMWRKLPDAAAPSKVPYPFYWSGFNTHEARDKAGRELAQLIDTIGKADPSARVHLVAHSHGGNVTLRALSHYLSLLRHSANVCKHDQITGDFWEEHAEAYKAVQAYQPIPGSHWTWRMLGPFSVVKVPWERDPDLGPFPWGGWALTDKLLGLPKVRQRKLLRKLWATSTNTNCVGRVVFMGTPFYSKFWQPRAWLAMLLNIVIMTAVFMAVIVAATAVIRALLGLERGSLPQWKAPIWVALGLGSFVLVLYNTLRYKRYSDGNLYFTEKKNWSPAMQALVLNAGKLDEAALALSTEPLVRAYLMPQLNSFMNPNPWRLFNRIPGKNVVATVGNLIRNFFVLLWNVLVTVPYLLLRGLNYFLVPIFSEALLKLFITLGFGLQKGELEYARVYVEEYLRLPEATHSILHWNVAKILSGAMNHKLKELQQRGMFSTKAPEGGPDDELIQYKAAERESDELVHSVAERWRFLWDDETLERKAKESPTLALLKGHLDSMQPHPRYNRMTFEREMKLVCLTLEERYKDMTGNVELSHGGYFRNIAVITAISNFLASGELPEWAGELGDVLHQNSLGPDPRGPESASRRQA